MPVMGAGGRRIDMSELIKRSCENCGNMRCANSIIAFWWDECVRRVGMKEIKTALYAILVFTMLLVVGFCLISVQLACA